MDKLTWKTARIVGYPDGDIWAVIAADHFDSYVGAPDTVAAADMLMRQALPEGGLVSEYLFLEQLERVALAAEVVAMQAQRDFLRCSVLTLSISAARARVEAARHRYVSDTMANLDKQREAQNELREIRGGSACSHGEAFRAMRLAQSQHADVHTPLYIRWRVAS